MVGHSAGDGKEGVAVGVIPVGVPGSGGVSRGRGDAEMIWGQESPGRTDAFKPEQLPNGRFLDPAKSRQVGVSAASPEVDPTAEAAGTQPTAEAAARSAWRRRLAPAHRAAVKKFFAPAERGEKQE